MTTELRLSSLDDLDWLIPMERAYHEFEAAKMGLKALHLEVDCTNSKAKRVYAKARFVERDKYLLMSFRIS